MLVQRRQRHPAVAENRGGSQRKRMGHKHIAQLIPRIGRLDPFDVFTAGAEHLDHSVGVTYPDRGRQLAD